MLDDFWVQKNQTPYYVHNINSSSLDCGIIKGQFHSVIVHSVLRSPTFIIIMIRNLFALTLILGLAYANPFPQAPAAPADGGPPPPPPCLPPLAPNQAPPEGPPPMGPDGKPIPTCPPTLVSGSCGGRTYFWDTALGQSEPEEFKKCFFGDGPVGAICNGKEYTWDPSKGEAKPADLATCEQEFAAKKGA